jgi:hypothetical protein
MEASAFAFQTPRTEFMAGDNGKFPSSLFGLLWLRADAQSASAASAAEIMIPAMCPSYHE